MKQTQKFCFNLDILLIVFLMNITIGLLYLIIEDCLSLEILRVHWSPRSFLPFFFCITIFLLLSFLFLCIFEQLDGCDQCFGQTAYPCYVFDGAASHGGHVSGLPVSVSISFNRMNICYWTSSSPKCSSISLPHALPICNSIQQNLKFKLEGSSRCIFIFLVNQLYLKPYSM